VLAARDGVTHVVQHRRKRLTRARAIHAVCSLRARALQSIALLMSPWVSMDES
jgi:hypothetical protein